MVQREVPTSLVAQMVKHLPTMWETQVRSLDWEDPLEKEMAIHSSILAWKIPQTEELVGYSLWGRKELDMAERLQFLSLSTAGGTALVPSRGITTLYAM